MILLIFFIGHPNILTLIECLHDSQFIFAVLPFCNRGELFSLVDSSGAMPEDQCRYWFKQILSGLAYLQSRYICHRDMSLENVLLHNNTSMVSCWPYSVSNESIYHSADNRFWPCRWYSRR